MKTWQTLLLFTAIAATLGYVAYSRMDGRWTTHQVVGTAIAIPGFFLLLLARLELGESFSVRPEARKLVTKGLYGKIRNPVYVFGAVFVVGLFLFLGQPYLFLLFLILIPVQILRARQEARVLEERFGDAYRAYRKQTWF